jgi:cytochrome c-type biogenesis protein CcmF
LGIAGSSLGNLREVVVIAPGQIIEWSGRSIQFAGLNQTDRLDKFVAEADLKISTGGSPAITLRPAQHFHKLQQEWTTEVAILSTWGSDLYTILHNGEENDDVRLTLVENPLIRWIWFGGCLMAAGAVIALWPARQARPMRLPKSMGLLVPAQSPPRRESVRQRINS